LAVVELPFTRSSAYCQTLQNKKEGLVESSFVTVTDMGTGEGGTAGRTELNEYDLTVTAGEFSLRDEYTDTDVMGEETSGSMCLLFTLYVCTPT
jgi:hypothetical protein